MSKKRVDSYLPFAYDALKKCGIANKQNEIIKTFRGHISTFGAAITMGSLVAAVAFFSGSIDDASKNSNEKADRPKLMKAIHYILLASEGKNSSACDGNSLFNMVNELQESKKDEANDIKDKILDAAVALKLAMNLYTLIKPKTAEE